MDTLVCNGKTIIAYSLSLEQKETAAYRGSRCKRLSSHKREETQKEKHR